MRIHLDDLDEEDYENLTVPQLHAICKANAPTQVYQVGKWLCIVPLLKRWFEIEISILGIYRIKKDDSQLINLFSVLKIVFVLF